MSRISLKEFAEMDQLLMKMTKQGLQQRVEYLTPDPSRSISTVLTELEREELKLAKKFVAIIEAHDKRLDEMLKNMPVSQPSGALPGSGPGSGPVGSGPIGGGPTPDFN